MNKEISPEDLEIHTCKWCIYLCDCGEPENCSGCSPCHEAKQCETDNE